MPSITVPISQLPQGVVPTIAALRAINASTCSDGDYVVVLGSGASNDGYQANYFFSGACTLIDNGSSVVEPTTPVTGAWIRSPGVPSITTAVQTSSYSGIGETLVLLSGAGPQVIYTLPPSYTMFGQEIVVKSLSTGAFQIRATGNDTIFPNTGVTAVSYFSVQSFLTSAFTGYNSYHFRPTLSASPAGGVYYQV